MSSLRRSSSGGNIRSASPSTRRRTINANVKQSSKSNASSVSDILSVSPMEMNKNRKPRSNSGKNTISSSNNLRNPKPKLTESFNRTNTRSQENKKSTNRPAWSLKQSIEDTPRSEASSTNTCSLPMRPSLDDFLDFADNESIPTNNKNRSKNEKKSLLEYLAVDTARTDNTYLPQDTVRTNDTIGTDRSSSTFTSDRNDVGVLFDRHNSLHSGNSHDRITSLPINPEDTLQLEKFVNEELEVKSWSSEPRKKNTASMHTRTSSVTSSSSSCSSKKVHKKISNNTTSSKSVAPPRKNSASFKSNKTAAKVTLKKEDNYLSFNGNLKKAGSTRLQESAGQREKAACCIQIWWRKSRIRRTAGAAAMKRMMENKRQEMELKLTLDRKKEYERQVEEFEDMTRRDEKARLARQRIINEMHNKRESNNKKNNEKTKKFMQSNGKVTKTTKNTKQKSISQSVNVNEKKIDQNEFRPDTASSVTRKVEEIFESSSRGSNSPRVLDTDSSPIKNTDDDSTLVTETVKSSKATLSDLLNTLKELEDEPIGFTKSSSVEIWGGSGARNKDMRSLSTEEVSSLSINDEKPTPGSLLSADKLKTIMSFLDEVEKVEEDVRSEVLSQSKDMYQSKKFIYEESSPDKDSMIDSASQAATDISNAITAQRLEIDENKRTVDMMKKVMGQQKEFTTMQMREMDKEHKQQLTLQRKEYESTIQRHLSFIDQLIDDKKVLTQRCEDLVSKLKDIDQKYSSKIKQMTENHAIELKKQKEVGEAAEKIRREKWVREKTQEIKEMTVKGLEPDIQKLIAKHKAEIKKIKAMKQGEVFEADERVGRKYVQQIEDIRAQLEKEKDLAVRKERENARQRFENQLREEEESFQQQRRRLYNEIEEEKERFAEQSLQLKREFDERRSAYEASSKYTCTAAVEDHEKKLREIERNHEIEMKNYKEQIDIEKEQWIENYMKKQETHLLSKERQLKEDVRDERDKEIEMVIARLEQETAQNREEAERAADNRIKRIRDKYENEIKELEMSEKNLQEKCSSMKERVEEMENTCIRLKSAGKQKEQELTDVKKLTDRLEEERGKVTDIIRQEFADRLVALEEESKRLRNELSEEKARHRFDVDRITKHKEDEMEEVHKRVKKAISKKEETTQLLRQQMQAAEKRAEHLEQLLSEQRKKILSK